MFKPGDVVRVRDGFCTTWTAKHGHLWIVVEPLHDGGLACRSVATGVTHGQSPLNNLARYWFYEEELEAVDGVV